jgi:hypothetical protein
VVAMGMVGRLLQSTSTWVAHGLHELLPMQTISKPCRASYPTSRAD